MVEQWLSLERQASALESNWLAQKPMLEQKRQLLEAEKKQLQSLLNEKSTDDGQVEQKRKALIQEQSKLELSQQEMETALTKLQKKLTFLQTSLSTPVKQAWQNESSKNAQTTDTPDTSAQLQLAIAQLNKLAEFDKRISVIQAPITNDEGEHILVKQLFMGAGTAWFVSLDGSYVGTGQVINNQWQWRFDNSLDSEQVKLAIAMFEKKAEAEFISLPLNINTNANDLDNTASTSMGVN